MNLQAYLRSKEVVLFDCQEKTKNSLFGSTKTFAVKGLLQKTEKAFLLLALEYS